MTKVLANGSQRRLVLIGAGGVLAVALGAVALSPVANADTDAAMLTTTESTVAEAVAQAEQEAAEAAQAAAVQEQTALVVDTAMAQVGDAYVYGASGPSAFDCSGFTMWVYQEAAGVSLPHNTHAQWDAIEDTWYVGEKEPQPGDLVFFFENGADHVGLYIGDGMMVHAENPGSGVIVSPIYSGYWADNLTGFGRVIH